jgi:hypothetical protein
MSKCLTVVALVLLVLIGTMGLRNIVTANAATMSSSNISAPVIWSNGPGPIPRVDGHVWSNGPGPIPRVNGHVWSNGPGPIPRVDSHVWSNGPGPIPR